MTTADVETLPIRRAGSLTGLWALLLSCFAATSVQAASTGQSFFDGFDRFEPSRWGISDGWVNGTWHNCTWSKRAVRLEGGLLHIDFVPMQTKDRAFICGEIQTKQRFGYGTYEARLKTPAGSGLNAAFFTYIGPPQGQPHDEIDFEVLTRDTSRVSLNTYVNGKPHHGKAVPVPATTNGAFNTYSFTWSRDSIKWYVNGALVHEARGPANLPVTPQKIFASFWGSDSFPEWMGPFEAPSGPLTMQVDWIAFTAEGEGCQFDGSVLCLSP